MTKTRVGIFGYGNLGRGVELACRQNDDMELVALFTRRDPATVKPLTEGVPVFAADEMASHRDNIDVLVLCGGSANDLPEQTPCLLYTSPHHEHGEVAAFEPQDGRRAGQVGAGAFVEQGEHVCHVRSDGAARLPSVGSCEAARVVEPSLVQVRERRGRVDGGEKGRLVGLSCMHGTLLCSLVAYGTRSAVQACPCLLYTSRCV